MLLAAQAGAAWAFRELWEDLSPVVAGYLRLHGAREPEDLTSEVFLAVFRSLGDFSGDEPGFRSWVFTIAHRRLIDERRRRGRAPDVESLSASHRQLPGGDAEAEAIAGLSSVWVLEALDQLTDDQREIVLLRVLAGFTSEEVAEITGRRPGAVRALQHRAIETLRRCLDRGALSQPMGHRVERS